MARNWFQHNYDARNDEKILELRSIYGWEGYGIFYGLLELMCENEKGSVNPDKIGGLSVAFGLPKDKVEAFLEDCVRIGLFYKDEAGMIRSKRITKHIEKMKSFSEAGKKGAKKRWSKQTNRGVITTPKPSDATPNAYKTRLDKTIKNKTLLSDLSSDEFNAMGDTDEKINWTTVRLHEKFRDRFGHYKTIKKATLEDWRDPIRLMHSEDGLEFKHIWSLIKHATTNDFWKDTVKSTSGLRNNWEELDASMRRESSKKNKQGKSEQANASAYVNDYTAT